MKVNIGAGLCLWFWAAIQFKLAKFHCFQSQLELNFKLSRIEMSLKRIAENVFKRQKCVRHFLEIKSCTLHSGFVTHKWIDMWVLLKVSSKITAFDDLDNVNTVQQCL